MKSSKAIYDLFSIFKIADVVIQIGLYAVVLLAIIFNIDAFKNVSDLMNMNMAVFASVGIYQALSFLFQLFSWMLFPSIYKARLLYILLIIVTMLLFIIGKNGIEIAFIILIFLLHIIALFYLVISIKETKLIIYAERKKLRR